MGDHATERPRNARVNAPARLSPRKTAPDPALADATPRPSMRPVDRLVEIMPLVALVLIAALVGSLVWLADRNERVEARQNLIRDALWVEQALRFQLGGSREAIEQLALDMGGGLKPEDLAGRFRTLIAAHPEIVRAEWRDGEGAARVVIPGPGPGREEASQGDGAAADVDTIMTGPPVRVEPHGFVVEMWSPVTLRGNPSGSIGVVVSLERLIAHHVPWWITQNNFVALVDRDGQTLASKSSIDPGPEAAHYSIAFDPPVPGAALSIAAAAPRTGIAVNALVAAIFGLAALAAASIFALQRHYRRRLEAETSLGEAQALQKAMEESLTVGMRARDLDGRIIYVNPAFCRMVGHRAEDLIGRAPPMPYWLPDLVEETLARHDVIARGLEPTSFETRFRRPDGSVFDVLVYEAPLIDPAGRHRGFMGSIIDVTDRKKAEALHHLQAETLARTGRLVTMGEMASTISHELNQPLAAIAGYGAGCLNLIRSGDFDADEIAAVMEKLDRQAQRAGQIVRRMHDFVRKREPRFGPVEIGKVLQDIAGFAAADARKHRAEVELDVADDLPSVEADRILIEQVVLNLVRNGIEAMGTAEGRRLLEVGARIDRSGDRTGILVAVADRGPGIDPAVADRLFAPFVTTKPDGMGMGLNICRSIVELHQGRLAVAPRPGGGTVFTVWLPVRTGGEA